MDFKSIFSRKFVDIDNSFVKNPVTKDISKKINISAIKQSCLNLLRTNRGERPFHPEIGTHISAMLFELITPDTISVIDSYVRMTLDNYEPRVKVMNVNVSDIPEQHLLKITVEVKIVGMPDTISFDLTLERTR